MACKKPPHVTVFKPSNGSGVEEMCAQIVSHSKATGHGIDDVIAQLAWEWFRHSQPSSTNG